MKCLHILLFIALIPVLFARSHVPFFRKDYTYIEQFDAFYKLHSDLNGISWKSAFITCDDEGATLFYPKSEDEWKIVNNLSTSDESQWNISEIFVALHDEYGIGEFTTVDGHPTSSPILKDEVHEADQDECIKMDLATGDFRITQCTRSPENHLPFVCKKVEDESCPTIDREYKFFKDFKKCYKVNNKPKMWQEAIKTCYMEGGTLAVLTLKESYILSDILTSAYYFVGIRKMYSNGDFYSVKGQKFSIIDANNNHQDCVTLYVRSSVEMYTSTADCRSKLPFICEMEVTEY